MSGNSRRYSYVQFMTFIMFVFLASLERYLKVSQMQTIKKIYKGITTTSKHNTVEYDQDYTC